MPLNEGILVFRVNFRVVKVNKKMDFYHKNFSSPMGLSYSIPAAAWHVNSETHWCIMKATHLQRYTKVASGPWFNYLTSLICCEEFNNNPIGSEGFVNGPNLWAKSKPEKEPTQQSSSANKPKPLYVPAEMIVITRVHLFSFSLSCSLEDNNELSHLNS